MHLNVFFFIFPDENVMFCVYIVSLSPLTVPVRFKQ